MAHKRSAYTGPVSDHWDGSKFHNVNKKGGKRFRQFLKWQFFADRRPWPKFLEDLHPHDLPKQVGKNQAAITFINHATTLIQLPNLNILTDPVWSHRVSPFKSLGPRRHRHPGVPLDQLPKIDLVLVSH